MTGLVEMASIPQWKQNITGSSRGYDEFGGKPNNRYDNMNISDIPSWKRRERSHIVSNSNMSRSQDGTVSNESTDSFSSSLTNNIPRCNEENGNDVKFVLGGNDLDTQEVAEMGFDCAEDDVDTSLSSRTDIYSVKGIDSSHLKHVQSNPFFRELGGVTHPHGRMLNESLPESPQLSRSGSVSTTSTEEELETYSPHSGIVEKLRKKFSSLNKDGSSGGTAKLRRYGSLDNLLDRGSKPAKHQPSTLKPTVHRSSVSSEQDVTNKPALVDKGKQLQTVNDAAVIKRNVPKPPRIMDMSKTRKGSGSSADEQYSPKARPVSDEIKDIVIIENLSKPVTSGPKNKEQKVTVQKKYAREDSQETELPKPNTVSNFRSLFEAGSSKQDGRKILPDVMRTPKFISASKPPPLPRSKPPAPVKVVHRQLSEPTSTEKEKELITNSVISSSSDMSHDVTTSTPSISASSNNVTTTVTSTVSSKSSAVTSVTSSEPENKPQQQNNNNLYGQDKPPRAFDSPVTKKREFGEKKSIFDSSSIEPTVSNAKPGPRVKRVAPKPRAPPAPVPRKSAGDNDSVTAILPVEKNAQDSELPVLKPQENMDENVVKVSDAVQNLKDVKDKDIQKKSNAEENKTLIFDSSSIVPKSKPKIVKKDPVENLPQVKAPPRPKAAARKLKQSESIDESENKTMKLSSVSTKAEDRIFEPVVPVKNENEISMNNVESAGNRKVENGDKLLRADDREIATTPVGLFTLSSSTTTPSEPPQHTARFAPVSELELKDVNKSVEHAAENNDGEDYMPKRGIPSIIANRLKPKDSSDIIGQNVPVVNNNNDDDESDDEASHQLVRPSQFRNKGLLANGVISSPVPKKKQTNASDSSRTETLLDLTKNSAKNSETQRTNIDDLIKGKRSSPVSVFDSSKIPAKKKTTSSTPAANGVPPLDLSLIEEKKNHPYQEGYIPTKIEPCKITFQGAGVKLKTKPLAKTRTQKLRIQFNDTATATHEYQSESAALHDYLVIHPHEEEEAKQEEKVLKLEDFEFADQESSDDGPETPRSNGAPDSIMKSNTAITHTGSGGFIGYKSKMSMDFEFGMSLQEEEIAKPVEPVNNGNPEDMDFLPADEENTQNWTDTSIPDMLF